jgi:hypothetical protein
MTIYKNKTNNEISIDIPVEYDENGNVTRVKTHVISPNEILEFNDEKENTNTIIEHCINNNLTQK